MDKPRKGIMIRRWTIATVVLLGAGCVTVPDPNYYTLDMRSSGTVSSRYEIGSMRIRAGEAVSRREIMIRTSPTQVEYYATQLWAAGVDEQVSEKLKAEIGSGDSGAVHVDIVGEVLAFEQVDTPQGADAHVKLDLTFTRIDTDTDEEVEFNRVYETTLPAAGPSAAAVVEALSRGMEQIAAEIGSDLARER